MVTKVSRMLAMGDTLPLRGALVRLQEGARDGGAGRGEGSRGC